MTINIFGATGLVGGHLLATALQHSAIDKVRIFVRKKINLQHAKLEQVVADFATLEQVSEKIKGDIVFNCLGTTLKKAGSKKAQYTIDCEYPIKAAQLAAKNGVTSMVSVSSVGATLSGNFYLKTKAEMEQGVTAVIGEKSYFVRPSFILGNRKETRLGEKIGIIIAMPLNYLLFGSLQKYRSIHAENIAKSMLHVGIAQPKGISILHYDDMLEWAK